VCGDQVMRKVTISRSAVFPKLHANDRRHLHPLPLPELTRTAIMSRASLAALAATRNDVE
jgi:hypothetical protein